MDELLISGKQFISSRRVARENGYTSDYVGQLIRGGKVAGQKVGRAWYVDAASFAAYLGKEAPAPVVADVVESEPEVVEQKVEVAPEPVVEAAIVEALSAPEPVEEVKEVAKEIVLEKIPEPEIEPEPQPEVARTVVVRTEEDKKAETVKLTGLRYYQEDAPSLPQVRADKKDDQLAQVVVMPEERVEIAPAAKRRMSSRVGSALALAMVGGVVLVGSAWLSSAVSLNLTITEGNAATATYGIAK